MVLPEIATILSPRWWIDEGKKEKVAPTVAPIAGKVDRRKSAAHHRVEEGQKPTKWRERPGDGSSYRKPSRRAENRLPKMTDRSISWLGSISEELAENI
jgi:hypothetical protein